MKHLKIHIKPVFIALLFTLGVPGISFAMPDSPVLSEVVTVQPKVRVVSGGIEITVAGERECRVSIYAVTGQIVKETVVYPGVMSIDLPKGYYIVKCDNLSTRVVVK